MSVAKTLKEKFEAIKAIFSATPPAPPASTPVKCDAPIVSYAVDGGVPIFTDITDDGVPGLDMNDYVFTDEALTTAYPDGTYKVTGTDFSFTVASGIITNIVDADGTGCGDAIIPTPAVPPIPPAPITPPVPPVDMTKATPAQMREMFDKFGTGLLEDRLALIETMLKGLIEYNWGYELRQASQQDAIAAYKDTIASNGVMFEKQEKFATQTIELLEQIIKEPTADPKTLPENKKGEFADAKEARINKFAEGIKKLNEDKKIK